MTSFEKTAILTIGHSDSPIGEFLSLLKVHHPEILIDIRSNPQSRFHPQFNRRAISQSVADIGIEYSFFGNELGGHPKSREFYDTDGYVIYERLAGRSEFRRGIREVVSLATSRRVVLMCAEEDPRQCHRNPLIARMLVERGFDVLHIRRDGSLEDGAELLADPVDLQLPLFEPPAEDTFWRSPKQIIRPPDPEEQQGT